MKTITRISAALLLALGLCACNKDNGTTVETLEFTYYNLSGTWQLSEWSGNAVDPSTYCYITLDRREHTFTMYQNFDSMYARCITGTYSIDTDDELGNIVSGKYDYDVGNWSHDYIVTDLTSDSMTWTASDDETDVCKYIRVDAVPDSIVAESTDSLDSGSDDSGDSASENSSGEDAATSSSARAFHLL